MKKKNTAEPIKKHCNNKFNIPKNAKGYSVKRVAFHRKVNKHA